jgi:hypothetical protein
VPSDVVTQQKVSSKTVTTSDGTIVHDFIDKSNIKDVKTIGTIGDSVVYKIMNDSAVRCSHSFRAYLLLFIFNQISSTHQIELILQLTMFLD